MSLTYEERRKTILRQLSEHDKVQVQPLAELLGVSTETIRRDLDRLEKEGRLSKVYGGAVANRMALREAPFPQRAEERRAEKAAIGKLAASLVREGETVMVDHGTTMLELVNHLRDRADVTIVTHSVPVLLLAMERFAGRVFFAGGEANPGLRFVSGPMTERQLGELKAHKAFLSVGGVSSVDGLTDYDWNEASVSRRMLERSEEAIVLADHSKLGRTAFARIAGLRDASAIVTDAGCPAEWKEQLEQAGVRLWIAEPID
ncbi:DeoR/GlpR family DNA-binding transcription regulator [Paenibacillus flagellatus]|uniref:DeoR/GlpR transcriptional regulator n=1 Tax=Paenibacillus flagellatus TaxID=2211139 RepID=A0A2V5JY90_9BACL|nr:DeoR/GlpR family DNA-binding transcription regulator [Paenibacillus flagellatus]PYI51839.1 DeoR/GlpR transcriptional regulator [Paenibacillus flagellatus]